MRGGTVGIIGGGVSGLATAVGLLENGISVQVFEAASRAKPTKTRVLEVQQMGLKALQWLGFSEQVQLLHSAMPPHRSKGPDWFQFFSHTGRECVLRVPRSKEAGIRLKKQALLDMLRSRLTPAQIEFESRVIEIEEYDDQGVKVKFENGSFKSFDFVVVCSGSGELPKGVEPKEFPLGSGEDLYQAAYVKFKTNVKSLGGFEEIVKKLLPQEESPGSGDVGFIGTEAIAVVARDAELPEVANIGCSFRWKNDEWSSERAIAACKELYRNWYPLVDSLVEQMPIEGDRVSASLLNMRQPFVNKNLNSRVTVMGDAFHAMSHFRGIGANLALMDAVVLCSLFDEAYDDLTTATDYIARYKMISSILRSYENQVVQGAKKPLEQSRAMFSMLLSSEAIWYLKELESRARNTRK